MNRPVHFEIHTSEPERAAKFYSDVFGWEVKEWVLPDLKEENRYWIVMTGKEGAGSGGENKWPGINGGMVIRKGLAPKGGEPVNAFVCTMDVEDIDVTMKKVLAAGGTLALGKMPIPGMGWLAYMKDTEGNIFGIMQDTSKK